MGGTKYIPSMRLCIGSTTTQQTTEKYDRQESCVNWVACFLTKSSQADLVMVFAYCTPSLRCCSSGPQGNAIGNKMMINEVN
jgi:hypothetical protein